MCFKLHCDWSAGVRAVHPPIRLQGDPEDSGALHPGADPAHPGGAAPALRAAGPGEHSWTNTMLVWCPVYAIALPDLVFLLVRC